jgi:hypothetical protein
MFDACVIVPYLLIVSFVDLLLVASSGDVLFELPQMMIDSEGNLDKGAIILA